MSGANVHIRSPLDGAIGASARGRIGRCANQRSNGNPGVTLRSARLIVDVGVIDSAIGIDLDRWISPLRLRFIGCVLPAVQVVGHLILWPGITFIAAE